jgi:malate permease and related proteins
VSVLLSIFANDVLPIFIVASVGFAMARVFKADVRTVSRITFNALSPCLVFSLMVGSSLSAGAFARMMLLTFLSIGIVGLLARVFTWPMRLDRPTFSAVLLVVMFSNSGNYGLPVVLFAFGRDALAHAAVYFVGNAVAAYSLGVFIASAGRKSVWQAVRGIVRVPAMWGAVGAALIVSLGVSVPAALMRPIDLLGGAALPVMILVLGMQLERSVWPERPGLVVLAVVLTLVVTPAIAAGVAELLGLTGAARQAAILQAGMPSAVLTTILALEFDVAPTFVTACVMLSTLASPLTVTLLIAALR